MDPQHRGVKCRINSGLVDMEKLYKWRIRKWEDWWTNQDGSCRVDDLQSHEVNKRLNSFSFLAAASPGDTNQLLIWLPLISDYIRLELTARPTACCRRWRATKEQLWWSFFFFLVILASVC